MKKLLTTSVALFIAVATFASNPYPVKKVMDQFNTDYPTVTLLDLSEINDQYVMRFMENGIQNQLIINKKNGKTEARIRYYDAKNLSSDVKEDLSYYLPHARIQGVTEVTIDGQTGYVVNMVTRNQVYVVNIDSDQNISVKDEFKRDNNFFAGRNFRIDRNI